MTIIYDDIKIHFLSLKGGDDNDFVSEDYETVKIV